MKSRRIFFITGLPRCRSAWFANYLTFGDSICLHDGFHGLSHLEEFLKRFDDLPGQVVGNSDPANVLYWRQLRIWYPEAVWIVIERPFLETLESCRKFVPVAETSLRAMKKDMEELISSTSAAVYDFHRIDFGAAREIASRCGVDAGPALRTEQLMRMNVQADPKWLFDQISKL